MSKLTSPSTVDPLPILATAVTPWTESYEFDEFAFRQQVRTIAKGLTQNIYIFGTAGEGYAVSERQFKHISAYFWNCAREFSVSPMLGIISLSLPTVIDRIEYGHSLGFREFQISLPSWGSLSDSEVDLFFEETCGRFQSSRFLHYNLSRAGRVLGPEDYRRLSRKHENLTSVKMGCDDSLLVQRLMSAAPRLKFYFTEAGYTYARRIAPCGLLISLASVNHDRALEFVHGSNEFRKSCAIEFADMLKSLHRIAGNRFHMDGAFDKILYRAHDHTFPLRLLPPYSSPKEDDARAFADALPQNWKLPVRNRCANSHDTP